MAMKCVAQIPYPIAAPAIAIQISRLRPCDAIARRNILTATILATKQTVPASRTSRQSCSSVRHAKTRYIDRPLFVSPTKYSGWIFNLANVLELSATWLSTCMSRLFQLYWSRPYSLHHPDGGSLGAVSERQNARTGPRSDGSSPRDASRDMRRDGPRSQRLAAKPVIGAAQSAYRVS